MAFIYRITNLINQKSYIGKTEYSNPEKRWNEHKRDIHKDRCKDRALYRAMRKYGVNNFQFEILEETDSPCDRERFYIKKFNTFHYGYNMTRGGDGTSDLNVSDQQVCDLYRNLEYKTLNTIVAAFGIDKLTATKILLRNGIEIVPCNQLAKERARRKVAQIDLKTGQILRIFDGVNQADRYCKGSKHISDVCEGRRKSCAGYGWKYIEDDLNGLCL